MDWLIEPVLTYGFFRTGLAAAAIVGVVSAVLSCLLVVRGQALLGDAISHAVLLGVAVGYLAGREVGVFWGALAAGVLSGMTITAIEHRTRIKRDAAMGIVFTFAFALGVAVISVAQPRGIDLFHVLFGNVLGVGPADLALVAASGGLVLAAVVIWFPAFHLWSFDAVTARTMGMRTRVLDYAFTVLLSAAIVASLQTVGLILVIAMLVTPGATAGLVTSRLPTMMTVAAGVGLLASLGGLYASFYADVASGPAIVILISLIFASVAVAAPRRGVAARVLGHRHATRSASEPSRSA